jgi:hypothetical protein
LPDWESCCRRIPGYARSSRSFLKGEMKAAASC